MKKYACLLLVCALMGCTRTPLAGRIGIAGAGSGNLLGTPANDGTSKEIALKRQEITDKKLEADAERIKNILNDTSDPIDLEHLTNRSDVDPDLAHTREFRNIQATEKIFDEKARQLIDNTGDTLNIEPETVDPALQSGRDLTAQTKTDQQLNDSASDFTQDDPNVEPEVSPPASENKGSDTSDDETSDKTTNENTVEESNNSDTPAEP